MNATKTLVQAFISCRLDYCNSLLFGPATDYFDACSRCRTLPPAWSQAPVGVATSHKCYGSCTGCQSVSALCSRSRGSYISRSLERLPRTSQTTVAFCRTLVVAHCAPTPMICRSCSCREHITNSVIVSFLAADPRLWNDLPPLLRRPGLTFDSFRQSLKTHLFAGRPKRLVTLLNV